MKEFFKNKRVLALAFVFALIASILSSCALGNKTMSDDDRAKADAIFATDEFASEKKEAFAKLGEWYSSAEKDADGYAALPKEEVKEGEKEKDQSIAIKIEDRTVSVRVSGSFDAKFTTEKEGEQKVTLTALTLSGEVPDSSSRDNIATIPEDIITASSGEATFTFTSGKSGSVPFSVKEIALTASAVTATKVGTKDSDFGDVGAAEINACEAAIKDAIASITPALNRAVTVYDPYADAIAYVNETATDSFSLPEVLRVPIGWILEVCFKLVRNYALALLIFALVMKIILFPFGIMQQKSTIKQAKFAPKQKAIMKKYEGRTDQVTKQKMQQEIMDAQQAEGVNMFGGCLPLLIQFPILFALFNVVRNPLRYMCGVPASIIQKLQLRLCDLFANGKIEVAEEILNSRSGALSKVQELVNGISATSRGELAASISSKTTSVDTLSIIPEIRKNFEAFADLFKGTKIASVADLPDFHIFRNFGDLSVKPAFWNWMLIIPVLTFIIVWATSKLTRKLSYQPPVQEGAPDAAASMKIMDWVMPLFSAYIAFVWPAIMGLYWIYQNLFGVLQQLILKKMYPLPEFTDADYKKAEMEVLGKNPKKPKYVPNNSSSPRDPSKPKSLHHIDDDDDDVPVNVPQKKASAPVKKNPYVEAAALKDAPEAKQTAEKVEDALDDAEETASEAVATLNGEKLGGEYTKRKRGKKSHRVASRPVDEAGSENADSGEDEEVPSDKESEDAE